MAMPPRAPTITVCELPHPPKVVQALLESERDAACTAALAAAKAIDGMFDPRRVRDRDPHDQPFRQFKERPDEFREAIERATECMAYSRSDSGLPSRREWKDCNRSLCSRIVRDHIPVLIRELERAGCDANDTRRMRVPRPEWKPLLAGLVEFWCAPSAREPKWTEVSIRKATRALAALRARLGARRDQLDGFATWFVREIERVAVSDQAGREPVLPARCSSSRLHDGLERALRALAWLAREHPDAETYSEKFKHLRACPAYAGVKLPKPATFERYARELRRMNPETSATIPE